MTLSLIVATDLNNGIGFENKIPWYIPEDLQYFKNITLNNTIIMGRKTFESLNNKPLKNRKNIVVTTKLENSSFNNLTFLNINQTKEFIMNNKNNEDIFIIGGSKLYDEFILECDYIYLTKINDSFKCDTYFNIDLDNFNEEWCSDLFESKNNNIKFRYYKLKNVIK